MKNEALKLINQILKEDPKGEALLYSQQCFDWLQKLNPSFTETQEIAARCQHFRRWDIPRNNFPMDKKGYYQWRIKLYKYQADKTAEILSSVGYSDEFIDEVKSMISKKDLRKNKNSKLIEDVACLVFLEFYIQPFSSTKNYSEEKWIKIIQKTWAKMSNKAHKFALGINYSPAIKSLISKALA
ncbi:MAG: hypothetical protein CMP67_10510 [Flavobacteriales bacterium]|nr:hypothetical protein [Flavobacteriales bacterium]MBO73549.1 hypothetical protein [Flavobacteriales bacterium]|tara:strand:- start:1414 stop:1965 length:552 start_codon:yes stop_codon:yes gene_type:complete